MPKGAIKFPDVFYKGINHTEEGSTFRTVSPPTGSSPNAIVYGLGLNIHMRLS